MWLLDVNLPNGLRSALRERGIVCDTAVARGWRDLTNGLLAEAAYNAGFRVILTRDRQFGESARQSLATLPGMALVVVTLRQARETAYLSEFEARWRENPIAPVAGAIVEWP